jgi:hypothetical protein
MAQPQPAYAIVAPDGSTLLCASSLLDLLISAKVLHLPGKKKRRVATKLPAETVTGLRGVIYSGETVAEFLRAAAAGEIARRERLFNEECDSGAAPDPEPGRHATP